MPQTAPQVTDAAGIQHCCGCGQQLQLQFDPSPGTLHMPQVRPKKWQKKKKTKKKSKCPWSFRCGTVEMNPTSIHEDVGSYPAFLQWVGDLVLPCAVV